MIESKTVLPKLEVDPKYWHLLYGNDDSDMPIETYKTLRDMLCTMWTGDVMEAKFQRVGDVTMCLLSGHGKEYMGWAKKHPDDVEKPRFAEIIALVRAMRGW